MAKTEMIRARMEPDLKHEAEAVLSLLGLSPTEAITLFYKQVTLQNGLPFEVKIPNAETREAMRQAEQKDGLTKYESVDNLMADFDDG
uniref:Addiction module antitoxin, RelB/DinJ family n=1 Tax=Magnetococcus massalia (strain MO-1) TaxID=451514 RepID=A0A1S7LC32_MAGMO|nr:Addiction module antitoxin, RelB/DinJ family [Candidatus Magnetococcus massalia]